MQPLNRLIAAIAALVGALMILSACQTQPAPIPEVTIKAADFSFEAPDQIEAGLVSLRLANVGHEDHNVQLVRLNDGVTLEQFEAALQQGAEAALALPLVTIAGGVGVATPNHHEQVVLNLAEGQYVMLCFFASEDGVPHLAKGMFKPIQVVARKSQAVVQEPKSDGSIVMKDFRFEMPAEIKAGRLTWKVTNQGARPHEIVIAKLLPGKTLDDFMAFMQTYEGEPPVEDAEAGRVAAMGPGQTGWVNLDLSAGDYVALCFVPDAATGKAHAEMGMIQFFSVK
ncbi:MAG: hypothetical protein ACRDGG_00280 [Anaerolineae bacterium]